MKATLTIEVEFDRQFNFIGLKEQIAARLEDLGDARCVRIDLDDAPRQTKMWNEKEVRG